MSHSPPALRVFVYGTLKRAQRNFDRYCLGAVAIEPAIVPGWLFALPQGYPMLDIPASAVLAFGTADGLADARLQYQSPWPTPIFDEPGASPAAPGFGDPGASNLSPEPRRVQGELITFDDPARRLRALDGLEDYRPISQTGEYWRVLTPLREPHGVLAWTYVAPARRIPVGATPCGEVWP